MKRTTNARSGFTLVEMLVISPFLILAIGAFIAVIISLTGEVLASRASNILAYNLQDALNRIEEDVKLSSGFLAESSISFGASNPQGYGANGSTTAFTNVGANGTSLILSAVATTGNPLSLDSRFVYKANEPNSCADPLVYSRNTPVAINIIYYVYNDALWRRVVMPLNYDNPATYCGAGVWQRPSCQPEYSHAFCKTNDELLLQGVSTEGFYVLYYPTANSNTQITSAVNPTYTATTRGTALLPATTASVSLGATNVIAGRDIERTGTVRVTRLDTNASALP